MFVFKIGLVGFPSAKAPRREVPKLSTGRIQETASALEAAELHG
jgi:hypothetical protein